MLNILCFSIILSIIFIFFIIFSLSNLVALCGRGYKNYSKKCNVFITITIISLCILCTLFFDAFNIESNNSRYMQTFGTTIDNDIKQCKTKDEINNYIYKLSNLQPIDMLISKNNNNEIEKISINYKYKDSLGLFYINYIRYIDYK